MPVNIEAGDDDRYRVYVLRLKNGDLYVGSTAHSIRARFEQHCNPSHGQQARSVKRFGAERIELELCLHRSYPTRGAAVRAERRLAERLRKKLANRGEKTKVDQGGGARRPAKVLPPRNASDRRTSAPDLEGGTRSGTP